VWIVTLICCVPVLWSSSKLRAEFEKIPRFAADFATDLSLAWGGFGEDLAKLIVGVGC
jgi:hypothetical protein